MKKTIVTLAFAILLSISGYSQIQFGAGASLALDGDSALGLQAKGLIGINEKWSGASEFTFWLKDGLDFTFNANAMYNLLDIGEGFDLRPIAGLNFTRSSFGDASNTDLGLNLGANIFLRFDKYDIYLEPKFQLIGDFDGLVLSAGILF